MNLLAGRAGNRPIEKMQELPHTHGCFVCGESNPVGLKLRFQTDGQKVQTHFVPAAEHAGFRHTVHGGIVGTVLDELMVWACAVRTRRFSYCGELTVRFIGPLRPGQGVTATGELVADRRGKMFEAKAEIRDEAGVVLATATGKYLPIKGVAADLSRDLVGDWQGMFEGV